MSKLYNSCSNRGFSAVDANRPESAGEVSEQSLLDRRLFRVSSGEYQSLLDLLDRPAQDNPGLRDLFSRPEPWEHS
jgi:uncharacterized protein (DUF1778 family)